MTTRSTTASGSADNPAVRFVRGLKHTGDFHGQPFDPRPFQVDILDRIFGPDGRPRYRKVFIAMPRKQGKTELAAAILLYLMFGTGRRGQRIFSAAGGREQAALIYGAAAAMARQSPALMRHGLCYDGHKRIVIEATDCRYQALSAEVSNQHGLRPTAVLIDELHVLPNRKLYTVLTSGYGATVDPLTIMITTAGWDRTSLCWEQWQYARDVRDGVVDDPSFLPILYETPEGADWTSEDVWKSVMPGLGDYCRLDFIREECRTAQQFPAYENTFRQLYLNQWVEQAVRWLQTVRWSWCAGDTDPRRLDGRACYGGLDLGVTGDMAVYVELFPDHQGGYDVLTHAWAPERGRWRQELRNAERYEAWHRAGALEFTPGEAIDHGFIERAIVGLDRTHPVRQINADRAYATQLLSNLRNGHGLEVKGISQSPVVLNEAMVKLESLILSGGIRHGGSPILAWNVANAMMRKNTTGLMYLDKSSDTERIDGLSALLDALTAAIDDPRPAHKPSVYESRGIVTV